MNNSVLVVYDDFVARQFAPFSLTRPLSAVHAGAATSGQRWSAAFGVQAAQFISSPHLDRFRETDSGSCATGVLAPGTILANARAVVALGAVASDDGTWMVGGDVAAVRLTKPLPVEALHDGSIDLASLASGDAHATLKGRWLTAPWDLIGQLHEQLLDDTAVLARTVPSGISRGGEIVGRHPVILEEGVKVEPFVVFDTTAAPVIVRAGAHINSFTRIAGPAVIGAGTHLLGGRIGGSMIGAHCRIHGDLSASVVFGYANKAHEGFVGHTVIGRWANLGAGTTTSNLKNSYGPVKLWTPEGDRDTSLTFLGSLIGDHAKLGIGTMLGTGTVVGAGANVFGTIRPPKRVPPFGWGDAPPYETFSLPKFLEVAERVMQRRNVELDSAQRDVLSHAHALAGTDDW